MKDSLAKLGNACFYEKADASGASTYFPPFVVKTAANSTGIASKFCTAPTEAKGRICNSDSDCTGTSTSTPGTCTQIDNVKRFNGLEGMCLEFDTLNPIYDGIYKDFVTGSDNYQPYACLTYFPFTIDTCQLHTADFECNYNPVCQWDKATSQCKHI